MSMKTPFFNLWIDNLSRESVLSHLALALTEQRQININFLNAHCFNIAQDNEAYRKFLNQCHYLLNDGIGVDIGARLLGFKFKDNLNGTDLIPEILALCEAQGASVYLLGAKPQVINLAKESILAKYPRLRIAGFSDGYFQDNTALLKNIADSNADVIIVGMGVPMQELWVKQNYHNLPNTKAFVCGGAIFDFLSGQVVRAPAWVRKLKMEWLFRLAQEPKRLFKRYVFGNFLFLYYVFKHKLKNTKPLPIDR